MRRVAAVLAIGAAAMGLMVPAAGARPALTGYVATGPIRAAPGSSRASVNFPGLNATLPLRISDP